MAEPSVQEQTYRVAGVADLELARALNREFGLLEGVDEVDLHLASRALRLRGPELPGDDEVLAILTEFGCTLVR